MTYRRAIVLVASILIALLACGTSQTKPEAGRRVAPTKAALGDTEHCTISTPETPRPVTAKEAEVLAIESVGGQLHDVETTADTREVCEESYEVWVVTGSLPNGDDTTTYVTRDTGQIIHGSISGGSD